jgi:hypothetical protein
MKIDTLLNLFKGSLTEIINGVPKGSGKALSALLAMLLIAIQVIASIIPGCGCPIDHTTLGWLLTFVCTIYGIKGFFGKTGDTPPSEKPQA